MSLQGTRRPLRINCVFGWKDRERNEKCAIVCVRGSPAGLSCFCAISAPSEVNRIIGARLSVEYEDKTSATVHVVNVSNKVIATVQVSYFYEDGSRGKSISGSGNVKPGDSITQVMGGMGSIIAVEIDAVAYADGSLETRNDAVAAEVREAEQRTKEQHEKDMEYARAFAVPNPASHMPPEEQIVRSYYSKLSFLAQLQVLSNVWMRGSSRLSEAALRDLIKNQAHFDLSDFRLVTLPGLRHIPGLCCLTRMRRKVSSA